jgi:glycosyltransferase involved in cell wall biosynthesis
MDFLQAAPVSVVIPAYNAERYIRDAITSIQAQTCRPSEIVVVDDGSSDRTASLASAFTGVRLFQKPNGGPGSARNLGLKHATQPLIAFLDADDIWSPRKIEWQIQSLQRSESHKLVFGMAIEFRELDATGAPVPVAAAVKCHLPGALLAPRSMLDAIGPFREDREIGDVIDWYARALDLGLPMETLDQVVLWRRIHATNLGRTGKNPAADYLNVLRTVINRRNGA